MNTDQMIPETLVSIVGAGPGDPKLLTIKAMECLKSADAVFYDALVNPIILSYCREGIERIPVGKRAGRHSHKQDSINNLLVQRALKGGRIVRLKGGDPFIFGRGGEEVEALKVHGIPFEVIPGLTAGITVPAYAGIPMTHRGISRSVTFITASTKSSDIYNLPWRSLAELNGSIAFYMGCRVIPDICKNLIEAGMAPSTPAAVISNGTLPNQRRLIATLDTFTPEFTNYEGWAPGLFVVGEVVNFSRSFDFFSTSEVAQRKVLSITMDREKSSLSKLIEGKVAYTHTMNMSVRREIARSSTVDLRELISASTLLFTTPSAVDATIHLLNSSGLDIRSIEGKIFSTGHTTTEKLLSYGIIPNHTVSKGVIPEAFFDGNTSSDILILSGDEESPTSWDDLFEKRGWKTLRMHLYREEEKQYCADDIMFLKEINFSHIVFSSTRAIELFGRLLEKYQLHEMLQRATLITYGTTTYQALKKLGYESITPQAGDFWRNTDVAAIILAGDPIEDHS